MRTKTRAFISYDFEHDEDKRFLLAEQSRLPDSPFEIADSSAREPLIGDWGGIRPGAEWQTSTW